MCTEDEQGRRRRRILCLCITVRDIALCWQMSKHFCWIPPRACPDKVGRVRLGVLYCVQRPYEKLLIVQHCLLVHLLGVLFRVPCWLVCSPYMYPQAVRQLWFVIMLKIALLQISCHLSTLYINHANCHSNARCHTNCVYLPSSVSVSVSQCQCQFQCQFHGHAVRTPDNTMAPYTNIPLSPAELSYLHNSLSQDPPIRPDGREPAQFRPLVAETDILPSANGSARICFADGTEAIVGVKAEVEKSRRRGGGVAGDDAKIDVSMEDADGDEEDGSSDSKGQGEHSWLEIAIEIPGLRDDDALPVFLSAMLTEALLADGELKDRLWINSRFHWRLYVDVRGHVPTAMQWNRAMIADTVS